MADIPLGADIVEEEAEVTDTLLAHPGSEYGTLLPHSKPNLQSYEDKFTPSQKFALQWTTENIDAKKKIQQQLLVLQVQANPLY